MMFGLLDALQVSGVNLGMRVIAFQGCMAIAQ